MVGSGDEEEESGGGGGGAELAVGVQSKQNERAHSFIILRLGQQTRRQGHAARGVDAAAVAATCGALQIFEMKLKSNKGTAERDTHTQTH